MAGNREWNESLFGCFDDCEICLCGCCFTPCLFGQNAEKTDGSNCCLMCCAYSLLSSCYLCWIPHCMKRENLREKYGLVEDPNCGDCPAACFCGPCALCQEARFLKRRAGQTNVIMAGPTPVMIQPQGHY